MSKSDPKNKQLNFKSILSVIFVLTAFIFLTTIVFDFINTRRSSRLYDAYAKESHSYIEENREGLTQIYADMQNTTCTYTYSPCKSINQDEIMKLISKDLTDFSSTAFIAINKSGELMLMKLSGERELLYSGETTTTQLKQLIKGTVSELPWDDYVYLYEGKEVVVPFKDAHGHTMGLLMRTAVAK